MAPNRNENWVIIQEQLAIYEKKIHFLRDCDQLLSANQQHNFNFDTVSSLLSMIRASVKNYSSVLLAFRMNIFNLIPVLPRGHLPTSFIPMETLLAIMDSVSLRQSKAKSRPILAIPRVTCCLIMVLVCSLMLLRYQKDFFWSLPYHLLHSKLFSHFLKQNFFQCLFRTKIRQLLHGTSKLHI